MSIVWLYLVLFKATVTSFSGMGSLPQIRQDLVESRRVMSDEALSQAVLIGRATPGPMGAYVVSVGYLAAGWPGAVAGWLALVTPAFLVMPLAVGVQRRLHLRRVRSMVDALVIGGAALLLPSGVQLAIDGLREIARLAG
jgi:chromate transporter